MDMLNNNKSSQVARPIPDYDSCSIEFLHNYISRIQLQLDAKKKENCLKYEEIDKADQAIAQLIQAKFQIAKEYTERKNKATLLKKEMEVKRCYLSTVVKFQKKNIVAEVTAHINQMRTFFNKINMSTTILNSFIEESKKEGGRRNAEMELLIPITQDGSILEKIFA